MFLTSFTCFAQENDNSISLSNKIRKNFRYDSLSYLSCLNTPPGIYLVKFQVDGEGQFSEFKANNDSLPDLNQLFINAIRKCSLSGSDKLKKGIYLQSVYFNNVLYCHPFRDKNNNLQAVLPDTSVKFDNNDSREVAILMNNHLRSIENSIANLDFQKFVNESMIWLPIVIIDNQDPNSSRGPGFRNDIRQNDITSAEIEVIQKLIEEKRRNKDGN